MTKLSMALATLVTAGVAAAPSPSWTEALAERFDAAVADVMEREQIPGAVILVGHREGDEWVTWQQAYGAMQVSPERRAMPLDAIFDLASMTKPIATGTSILILQDRGLLSVEDRVSQHLAEYDTAEKRDIRIRDLMTHVSGLPSYIGEADRRPLVDEHGYVCPGPMRDMVLTMPLQRPARSAMVYSCLNAITCAQIVERVSGQPFNEFAEQNIFEPLGMGDTSFSPGPGPRVVPTTQAASAGGEFLCGMVHDPLANMQGGVSGNAGLFSTAQDLSRFAQMMLGGGAREGVRILSEDAVSQATHDQLSGEISTPHGAPAHRGLLWETYLPEPGDEGIETIQGFGHTGYTGTAMRLWPSQQLYVIALTNRVHPDDSARVTAFRRMCWRTAGEVVAGIDDSITVLKDATPIRESIRESQRG